MESDFSLGYQLNDTLYQNQTKKERGGLLITVHGIRKAKQYRFLTEESRTVSWRECCLSQAQMDRFYFNLNKQNGKYTGWTWEEDTKSQGEKSATIYGCSEKLQK